jgi:hypothetical protein
LLRLIGYCLKWFTLLFTRICRWLLKLTDKELKKERVRTCEAFVEIFALIP